MGIQLETWRRRIGCWRGRWKREDTRRSGAEKKCGRFERRDFWMRVLLVMLFLSIYAGPVLRKDCVDVGGRRVEVGLGLDLGRCAKVRVEETVPKMELLQEQPTCGIYCANWIPSLRIRRSGDVESNPGPPKEETTLLHVLQEVKAVRKEVSGVADKIAAVEKKLDQMKTKQTKLEKEVEATKSLVSEMNQGWSRIEKDHASLENRLAKLEEQLEGQDLSLRRCNLIISGMPEEEDEVTQEQREEKVHTFLHTKLDLQGKPGIEWAYRIGRKKEGTARLMIMKLGSIKDKAKIMQARRELPQEHKRDWDIFEDLPWSVRERRKKLIPAMLKARKEGKAAYLVQDRLKIDGVNYRMNEGGQLEEISHKSGEAARKPNSKKEEKAGNEISWRRRKILRQTTSTSRGTKYPTEQPQGSEDEEGAEQNKDSAPGTHESDTDKE